MKIGFSRIVPLAAAVTLAVFSSGCTVSGGGKIPSVVPGTPAGMTFSVDFTLDDSVETITGTANIHDHGNGVNALGTFSEEAFVECINTINEEEVTEFLNEALFECLNVDETGINQDDIALVFGHYRLRGKSRKTALANGLAAEGCCVGIYLDLGQPGSNGDGVAIALIDASDPDSIYYSNCGALTGGNIKVDLLID